MRLAAVMKRHAQVSRKPLDIFRSMRPSCWKTACAVACAAPNESMDWLKNRQETMAAIVFFYNVLNRSKTANLFRFLWSTFLHPIHFLELSNGFVSPIQLQMCLMYMLYIYIYTFQNHHHHHHHHHQSAYIYIYYIYMSTIDMYIYVCVHHRSDC